MKHKLQKIPTNIITGFLGAGKTTAILHLLGQKPDNERWAILVNEFGEVGIDGSIFEGLSAAHEGIFIREVPGGCMCCSAGLPLQIALTLLLNEAKPDRLLIEPTGLGHPKEVIETLSNGHYLEVLNIQQTITLVDARKVSDERYKKHATFIQQLEVADIIVANKIDQYDENDMGYLREYLNELAPHTSRQLLEVSMGSLDIALLEGDGALVQSHSHQHAPSKVKSLPMPGNDNFPKCGYLMVKNTGEGFYSQGWIFKPEFLFDNDQLNNFFLGVQVDRLKGVFITNQGSVSYNKADGVLTELPLEKLTASRIEWIHSNENFLDIFEPEIMNCLLSRT